MNEPHKTEKISDVLHTINYFKKLGKTGIYFINEDISYETKVELLKLGYIIHETSTYEIKVSWKHQIKENSLNSKL